jgi:hypothetical protein
MRTCTTKRALEAIVHMEGLDPDTAALTAAQKALRAELLNDRVLVGWEYAFWQETLAVEQREYQETYDAAANYSIGDEVYYASAYYTSLIDGNVGNTPGASPTAWEAVGDDFIRHILFEQPDETIIHRVDCNAGVFDKDPRVYRDAGRMTHVRLLDDRIVVEDNEAPIQPWIRFQTTPPEFSWTAWSAATAYAIGDLCYVASTGHTYKALLTSTNKDPVSETTYWEEVGFPNFLLRYVKHAVASDLMHEDDGKYKEQATAEGELERMADALQEAQGQGRQAKFR